MPQTHVPVLAGELIEALDPQPGQIAIDCTLGGAGHARLVADRIGPAGTPIAIDPDPPAQSAFEELAHEGSRTTPFLRAAFPSRPETPNHRGIPADPPSMGLPRGPVEGG